MGSEYRTRPLIRIPVRNGKGECVAWTFTKDPRVKSVREGTPKHIKYARHYGQLRK